MPFMPGTGMAKKFIWVFLLWLLEKLKQTFIIYRFITYSDFFMTLSTCRSALFSRATKTIRQWLAENSAGRGKNNSIILLQWTTQRMFISYILIYWSTFTLVNWTFLFWWWQSETLTHLLLISLKQRLLLLLEGMSYPSHFIHFFFVCLSKTLPNC